MTYGEVPWQQQAWDWRAAGNFMAGGAGSGLIVFAALSTLAGRPAPAQFACGAALVSLGLFCVWLEIGRPLRALHVFFHPGTSWMSREAFVAAVLMPCALAAAFGIPFAAPLAGVLALAFVYSQARILKASRGIPAWREPRIVPLVVATGLAEGGGLFMLSSLAHGPGGVALTFLAAALVLTRWLLWRRYRGVLVAPAGALTELDGMARRLLWVGTLGPLALIGGGLAAAFLFAALDVGASDSGIQAITAALGGAGALLAGAWFKFILITRAAFNQGFAIQRLPVRGVRRAAP